MIFSMESEGDIGFDQDFYLQSQTEVKFEFSNEYPFFDLGLGLHVKFYVLVCAGDFKNQNMIHQKDYVPCYMKFSISPLKLHLLVSNFFEHFSNMLRFVIRTCSMDKNIFCRVCEDHFRRFICLKKSPVYKIWLSVYTFFERIIEDPTLVSFRRRKIKNYQINRIKARQFIESANNDKILFCLY